MSRLIAFNSVSLDGYVAGSNGDLSWAKARAHSSDEANAEWDAFVAKNASGDGTLLFGRVTYDMMQSFWPTPQAKQMFPAVAEHMNKVSKAVFSRTLEKASWNNTTLIKDDIAASVRQMKNHQDGATKHLGDQSKVHMDHAPHMTILGSASIVAQLAQAGLIDEFQMVVVPVALGSGKTMFDGIKQRLELKLVGARTFKNGNVVLRYEPAK